MITLHDLTRITDYEWEIPQTFRSDMRVPAKKLAAAAKKPGKMGQRARLAQTLKGMK